MRQHYFLKRIDNNAFFVPSKVFCTYIKFDDKQYRQELFQEHNVDFPSQLRTSVISRKSEYLAGRIAARLSLKALSQKCFQIPSRCDRSPIWPNGIIGSITHTKTEALALVAYSKDHYILGADLENWLEPHVADELEKQIICSQEKQVILGSGFSFSQGITLAFSAKESLYKALYPHVNKFFGFDDVRINSVHRESSQYEITLNSHLSSNFVKGTKIAGYYAVTDTGIFTTIHDGIHSVA